MSSYTSLRYLCRKGFPSCRGARSSRTWVCSTYIGLPRRIHLSAEHSSKLSDNLFLRRIQSDSVLFPRTFFGQKSNVAWEPLRRFSSRARQEVNRNKTTVLYVGALAVTVLGFSYAAVPLYRLYCQASGLGGTVKQANAGEKIEQMERKPERVLKIRFNADTSSTMQWKFRPQQTEVMLVPGETALAFYTATNPTDVPITGISTYNVIPFEAGQYFNKIQCFCFEEQRLNPKEQVDMPVFFYIDPEFTEDPSMAKVDTITLSYTFFESKEAEKLGL